MTNGLSIIVPVIVYNGVFIINATNNQHIASHYFNEKDKIFIIDLLKQNHLFPLVYSFVDNMEKVPWIISKENEGFKRYIQNRKNDKRLNPLENSIDLYNGNIFYFTCIGEKDELLPIYNSDIIRSLNIFSNLKL